MSWYPWLTPLYHCLITQQQKWGHPVHLFYAHPGCGIEQLVRTFAGWLLCRQPQGTQFCGHCHPCTLMAVDNHPDWQVITVEKGKSVLGIEPIRALIEQIQTCPQQGGVRVIAITESERLNQAAANALLKTLEEPPAKSYFLLACQPTHRLPVTLRSRCQQWRLGVPDQQQALTWLQSQQPKLAPQQLLSALRLGLGAPLAALTLLQAPLFKQRFVLYQGMHTVLQQGDFMPLLVLLNHSEVSRCLHWLATLWLDGAKQRQGAFDAITHCDQQALVLELAAHFSHYQLQQHCQLTLRCRNELLTQPGLNQTLLLTELLYCYQTFQKT